MIRRSRFRLSSVPLSYSNFGQVVHTDVCLCYRAVYWLKCSDACGWKANLGPTGRSRTCPWRITGSGSGTPSDPGQSLWWGIWGRNCTLFAQLTVDSPHERSHHFGKVSRPTTLTDAGGVWNPLLRIHFASTWRKVTAPCRQDYDEVICVLTADRTVSSPHAVA